MFAHVKGSSRPTLTLEYNEQKLIEGKAEFLAAYNYWEDKTKLEWSQKLERLYELSLRNERSIKNIAHMSLNFHPGDNLTNKQMGIIAAQYLKNIGFADQPALVYRHMDAGHPHCHIVSTNIRPDGTRISNDLRSPRHLEEVCRKLEHRHHLTPVREMVDGARQRRQYHPTYIQRLQYGQSATRTGIENVLHHTLEKYAYISIEHLNAVLSRYNVMADRGSPQSHLYRNRGLYYRMLNDEGQRVGAPIKASAFDSRPTLDYLERRFAENQVQHHQRQHMEHVCTCIDWNLLKGPVGSLEKFTEALQKERLQIVVDPFLRRQAFPEDGHAFYYIDHLSRNIYRDTELGEKYTALSMFQRMGLDQQMYALVQRQQLHLTHKKEEAILQQDDPGKKLQLWIKLARQHNELVRTMEKEKVFRHRQQQRGHDMEYEL